MANDTDRDKLEALSQRIREAETAATAKPAIPELPADREAAKGSQIGFEFAAVVLVCTGAGWLIDLYLSTKPWGLLLMLCVGFAIGMFNVWRMLNGYGQSVGFRKRD